MNGRVYDPSIGKFISADPRVQDMLYSQAFNRYQYAYGNSLAYIDPSGFDGCDTISAPTVTDGAGASFCGQSSLAVPKTCDPGDISCWAGPVEVTGCKLCAQINNAIAMLMSAWLSMPSPGANNESPGKDPGKDPKKDPKKNKDPKCGTGPGLLPNGVGIVAGANGDIGAGTAEGAAATGSVGAAIFTDSNGNMSAGAFATAGIAANSDSGALSAPASAAAPIVGGASGSAGVSALITNAQNVLQLKGPFSTYSGGLGIPETTIQVSGSFSIGTDAQGDTIWEATVSPPEAGVTQGISGSVLTTNTVSLGSVSSNSTANTDDGSSSGVCP